MEKQIFQLSTTQTATTSLRIIANNYKQSLLTTFDMASKQPLTVDFSRFSTGSISEKLEIANQLARSIHETGFCRLVNHDVSKETLDRLFSQSAVFFKLPFDVKSKVKHPPTFNPHRVRYPSNDDQLHSYHLTKRYQPTGMERSRQRDGVDRHGL